MSFLRDFPGMDNYQGDLGWIVKKLLEFQELADIISELQAALDALPETIRAEVTKQVDAALAEIYKMLDEYDARIKANETEVSDLRNIVFNVVAQISSLYSFIETYTNLVGEKVFNQLKAYIDQWSKELPPCVCPVDGELEPINTALRHLYDFYNRGISASNYDDLVITADTYERLNISAKEYDAYGTEFFNSIKICSMISPFSGQRAMIYDVINKLADFHKNGISALEYDSDNISAEMYEDKNISAYVYDWKNPYHINTGQYIEVGDIVKQQADLLIVSAERI